MHLNFLSRCRFLCSTNIMLGTEPPSSILLLHFFFFLPFFFLVRPTGLKSVNALDDKERKKKKRNAYRLLAEQGSE